MYETELLSSMKLPKGCKALFKLKFINQKSYMKKNKYKELECLFAWAAFYSNGKNLAVETLPNQEKFNIVKKQIDNLKKEIID
jgi:hypothetical protein